MTITSTAPVRRLVVRALSLAASPVFAVMAWLTVRQGGAICAAGNGPLPLDGMTMMYLLMSLFHLPAWLAPRAPAATGHHPRKESGHDRNHRITR